MDQLILKNKKIVKDIASLEEMMEYNRVTWEK
jgi:hypothetical protein